MKNRIILTVLAAMVGTIPVLHPLLAVAAETSTATTSNSQVSQTPPARPASVELPQSVVDVLQLVKAKVSDDTILAFIKRSVASYPLNSAAVIYLHKEGVSDRVLTAMLDHSGQVTEPSTATMPTTNFTAARSAPPTATTASPTAAYVQTVPTYVPSSTVYVAPSAPTYVYSYGYAPYYYYPYYYYPYRGGWYGYGYPAISFSFGYSSYSHGGYYHGGYGGGHHH